MTYFKKSIKENFDTMKKNVMLKIASVLMVAVLLTTCAISSTFAKYVSTPATDTVTARAAKWGLVLTAKAPATNEKDIFESVYKDNQGREVVAVGVGSTDLLLAPGTSSGSDAFGFTAEGTPEVAVNLLATINVTLSNWADDKDELYFPVKFYINGSTTAIAMPTQDITDDSKLDLADYEKAIEEAIATAIYGEVPDMIGAKYTKTYAPNTNFANQGVGNVTITWEWPDVTANNAKDTALGNAALTSSTAPTITIAFTIEAEQSMNGVAATQQGN
jgi:hypothetical protein